MTTVGTTVAGALAAWAAGLRLDEVPDDVRAAVLRHLLDGTGTALAAARSGAAAPAVAVAAGLGGPPEATLLGAAPGTRVGAAAAALATGTLVHALDFDDTHAGGLVHATAVVLPAALHVGEQVGASGEQVLLAALVGYEAVCRVAAAAPHGFHARGVHATMACGTLAAALVSCRLMGLSVATTRHALGVAGSSSGGLLEFLAAGEDTKALHPGLSGHAGVLAARLAAAGATGPATVVEGRHGLWAALTTSGGDPRRALDGLGQEWETTRITVKPYPACQLLHVTLDAAADAARAAGPLAPGDVVDVQADVHPDSAGIVCEPAARKRLPRTPYDAKFSLPWSLAALLLDGRVDLATYTPASLGRRDVAALAARVRTQVVRAPGPAADAPGRVRLLLADGRTLVGEVPVSRGGPAAPLSDALLSEKFRRNAGADHRPEVVEQLLEALRALPSLPDVHGLLALAARAGAADPEVLP